MDTSKIVSLKQESITLESKIQDLTKKVKSKRLFLILGIISLIITFIVFFSGSDGEGSDATPFLFFLFAISTILFFILSFLGGKKARQELALSKNRLQEIKLDLVKLEYEAK